MGTWQRCFGASPENLATEALNDILQHSQVARSALVTFIAQSSRVSLQGNVAFHTQVGSDDGGYPDLIGFDAEGRQSLIIEAKFWAGLTDKQPVSYLARLPQGTPGVLVLLAPALRLDVLWHEVLRRCTQAGTLECSVLGAGADLRVASISRDHALLLVSWRRLLMFLLRDVEAVSEGALAADILQLQGLCDRMDAEAFVPLRSEELTSGLAIRLLQLYHLVNEVTQRVVTKDIASAGRGGAGAGFGYYGKTLTIQNVICFLSFNVERWAHLQSTPLWLSLYGRKWGRPSAAVRKALFPLEAEEPPRLYSVSDCLTIPLYVPTGVEKEAVIQTIVDQIGEVAGYLASAKIPAAMS